MHKGINSKYWKLYFWLLLLLYVAAGFGYVASTTNSEETLTSEMDLVTIVKVIVYTFTIYGVYGFSFKKRFLSKEQWKIIFVLSLAVGVHGLGVVLSVGSELSLLTTDVLAKIMLGNFLLLPQYIALYLYGWKSKEIWEQGQ